MKIFLDTADISFIARYIYTGLIDGVTTNPTNLSKEGSHPAHHIEQLCKILPEGVISVEVTEEDPDDMYRQAHEIASMNENIMVKIPCHIQYYGVIRQLIADGIPLNITLIFSAMQAVAMAKLGVTIVSPFVGRLDEIHEDGVKLVDDITNVFSYYQFETAVLAASLRTIDHVHKVMLAGADVITVSPELFVEMLQHPLTDKGMKQFANDWSKLGIKQFP